MMDYGDFMSNLNRGYSSLYQAPAGMASVLGPAANAIVPDYRRQQDGCCRDEREDCSCNCCIQCADIVEYAYCGETRKIPVTFDNDSRRERQISLQIGGFKLVRRAPAEGRVHVSADLRSACQILRKCDCQLRRSSDSHSMRSSCIPSARL